MRGRTWGAARQRGCHSQRFVFCCELAAVLSGKRLRLRRICGLAHGPNHQCTALPSFHPATLTTACSAINEVAWTATLKQRAWDAPVPPLVQQFCALGLPERLLERVSQRDVPADTLERTLDVMSQLSLCSCGQVRDGCACGSLMPA